MSIGERLRRKRPRNDLDEFLDQVESRLFCVTDADKRCLLRDLKAHVKELTTDPKVADRYGGMYGISMDQLREEIGNPSMIAADYIASVKRKVPSIGLKVFVFIMSGIFIASMAIGIDRIGLSGISEISNTGWLRATGYGLVIGGLCTLGITVIALARFDRYHILLAILAIVFIPFSITASEEMASILSSRTYWTNAQVVQELFSMLFIVDFVILSIIGLYLYLMHYRVMNSRDILPI